MSAVTVTLRLNVSNEQEFREAACVQAQIEGSNYRQASRYLDASQRSVWDCAQLLIDPAITPDSFMPVQH